MQFKLEFHLSAILSFAALFVTSGLETIGNTSGITIAGFDREATEKETSGAILADALGSTTAAVFNALPNTAFGQNAGIVAMTKVVNKWCIATGAFILMISGFFPKLGAIFSAIPNAVLGGAIITVFGMILINGIKMIAKAGFSERNILVMGLTFAFGLGMTSHPDAVAQLPSALRFIFSDSVTGTCIVAIVANFLFPMKDEEDIKKCKRGYVRLRNSFRYITLKNRSRSQLKCLLRFILNKTIVTVVIDIPAHILPDSPTVFSPPQNPSANRIQRSSCRFCVSDHIIWKLSLFTHFCKRMRIVCQKSNRKYCTFTWNLRSVFQHDSLFCKFTYFAVWQEFYL